MPWSDFYLPYLTLVKELRHLWATTKDPQHADEPGETLPDEQSELFNLTHDGSTLRQFEVRQPNPFLRCILSL